MNCSKLHIAIVFALFDMLAVANAASAATADAAYAKSLSTAAAATTVFIDSRSGPWDVASNPGYSFGYNFLPPTSVSSAAGLPFVAGDTLRIEYVSGLANAGGGGIWNDANGARWWPADDPGRPAYYIAGTNYLEQVVGVFSNAGGVIVGSPFTIGNGPVFAVIPKGATQLQMGFNDDEYIDNLGGGVNMKVTEMVPEPETYAMMIVGLGLIGACRARRSSGEKR
jgi:hypothetical protein